MREKVHQFIYETRYSGLIVFGIVVVVLSLWFVLLGALTTSELPHEFATRKQLIGMVLMLIILPAYLVAGLILGQRQSVLLAEVAQAKDEYRFSDKVKAVPYSYLIVGLVFGLIYSLSTLPSAGLSGLTSSDGVLAAITSGQILLWAVGGVGLAVRYHVAHQFYLAGNHVAVDLFEMSNLKPFGRAGLIDVFLIIAAFGITLLQALDAQFRVYNYLTALMIVVPAIVVLMIMPMFSLHRRIVSLKNEELEQVNNLIRSAPKGLLTNQMDHLEPLLQRRERLLEVHAWPLDMAVVSRLMLYVIVPPLAWLGAAFVEIIVDKLLGI